MSHAAAKQAELHTTNAGTGVSHAVANADTGVSARTKQDSVAKRTNSPGRGEYR